MPVLLDPVSESILGISKKNSNGIHIDPVSESILSLADKPKQENSQNESKGVTGTWDAPKEPQNPDQITTIQKVLTNPIVAKIIDGFSSGMQNITGMTPQEQQDAADKNVAFLKSIPEMAQRATGSPLVPNPINFKDPSAPLDMASNTLGVLSAPFMPAFQGMESGIQSGLKGNDLPSILKATAKGATNPTDVKLLTDPANIPFTPQELNGDTASLVPRAVMQGLEQVVLGHVMGGGLAKDYAGAKTGGVQKDFETDFEKLNPDDVKNHLADNMPGFKDLTPEQQAVTMDDAIKSLKVQLQNNPAVGDYYASKQTPIKLAGDALQNIGVDSERGSTGVPEENKPIVAFHGTDAEPFTKFEDKNLGKNKAEPAALGHWFVDDKMYAEGHGKNIIEANLQLENPKVYTRDAWDNINKGGDFSGLRQKLESEGYDGIKVLPKEEMFGNHKVRNAGLYSVFNPNKIKINTKEVPNTQAGINLTSIIKDVQSESIEDKATREIQDLADVHKTGIKMFGFSPDVYQYLKSKPNIDAIGQKLSDQIPPTKYKNIINSNLGIKRKDNPVYTERQALAQKFKTEQKGVKSGEAMATARELNTRSNMIQELKRQSELSLLKNDIQNRDVINGDKRVKGMLVNYIKDNLPKEERGGYLEAVHSGKTYGDAIRTFRRIDKHVSDIQRKEVITDIKSKSSKALESGKVAIDYKNKIDEIIKGIEFSKRRPETLDKLRATRNYIESSKESGKDVEMPDRILKQLEIFHRKPANDLSVSELKNISANIDDLMKLGETKQRTKESIYNLQKDRIKSDLVSGTIPLEKNPVLAPTPGEKLSIREKFNNIFPQMNNIAQHFDLAITPMDTFFDLMDGGHSKFDGPNFRNIKKTLDVDYQSYLKMTSKHIDSAVQMAHDLKLNDQNFERIGVHAARMQEGGFQKLLDTELTKQQIDKIELTENEMKFYKMMRRVFDELRPDVAETMKNVWNQPLKQVDNYVSFMTDFDKMSDSEIFSRIGENAPEFTKPTKNVEKGFTKERKGGFQPIKLNAMDIFLKHVDNVGYLVNMSRDLKMISEIINSPEYGKAAGDLGQTITKEWLDLMARKGGLAGDHRIAILDTLRRNFGLAQLGLNVTSALIQPTALMDGAAVIGNYAFDGMYKVATDKSVRQFIMDNMPELKRRIGDDPAFVDFGGKFMKKLQEKSYAPLKFFDGITAQGVAWGAYLQKMKELRLPVDLEIPNKDALEYAQKIVRVTQASGSFKDEPLAISRGKLTGNRSFDKALLQFQNFMLTRWNIIRNYLWRANIEGGRGSDRSSKDFKKSFTAAFMIILALLLETQARRGIKSGTDKLFGKEQELKNDFSNDFWQNAVSSIPFVSQIISTVIYNDSIIPAASFLRNFSSGTTQVGAKKPETQAKGIVNLASAFGQAAGIPGTAQASKIAKAEIYSGTKDNVVDMFEKAYKSGNKNDLNKAVDLANKNGVLIEDAEKSAEQRVIRELSKNYDEVLNTKNKELLKDTDIKAKGWGFNDDEISHMKDLAEQRADKKEEKKSQIAQQQSDYEKSKH